MPQKPDWFTQEKYKEFKDQGLTERQIAEEKLFVSESTYYRIKTELGMGRKSKGKKVAVKQGKSNLSSSVIKAAVSH